MKKEYTAAIVSVPVEQLRYKYNEAEELVIGLKEKLSMIYQQVARDTEFTVMSNGDFGVPLWSLEVALAIRGLGQSVRISVVVPCNLQDEGWAEDWRDRYYKVIEKADSALALPLEYTDLCETDEDLYEAADRYMIDNCDIVIAVTAGEEIPDAVDYAKSKGCPIIYIDSDTLEIMQ